MFVTITRRAAIEIGEEVIAATRRYMTASDTAPEVIGLRRVLSESNAVARATCRTEDDGGVDCPMVQAGFDLDRSDLACSLALNWDQVTRAHGLHLVNNHLIRINP